MCIHNYLQGQTTGSQLLKRRWAWIESKLFWHTDGILNQIFENKLIKKFFADNKRGCKIIQHAKIKLP